jgi:septal ring factor EnvC (AmiA/AmiB activator)
MHHDTSQKKNYIRAKQSSWLIIMVILFADPFMSLLNLGDYQPFLYAQEAIPESQDKHAIERKILNINLNIAKHEFYLSKVRNNLIKLTKQQNKIEHNTEINLKKRMRLLSSAIKIRKTYAPNLIMKPDKPLDIVYVTILLSALYDRIDQEIAILRGDINALNEVKKESLLALKNANKTIAALYIDEEKLIHLQKKNRSKNKLLRSSQSPLQKNVIQGKKTVTELISSIIPTSFNSTLQKNIRFSKAKGQLFQPVAGQSQLSNQYGGQFYSKKPRLIFTARSSARVFAPWSGEVRFSGEFLNYGKVIIIEPEPDYLIVLTGLYKINYTVGDRVDRGAVVGYLEAPTDFGNNTDLLGESVLGMEIRHKNKLIDPAPWLQPYNG